MSDVNKCFFLGRCTRDPELKYLPNQTAVCTFGFAVGRKWKDASGAEKSDVAFLDCVVWGKQAETFQKYNSKGSRLHLECRARFESWDDKTSGQKRSKITFVVENFVFLDQKKDGQQEGPQGSPAQSRPAQKPQGQKQEPPDGLYEEDAGIEDAPF